MDKKKLDDIIHFVYNKERKLIVGFFRVDNVTEFGWVPEADIEYQTNNAYRADKLTKSSYEDLKAIIGYGDGYLIKPKKAFEYYLSIESFSKSLKSYCWMSEEDVHNKPRYAYSGQYKVVIVPMTQKQCDVFIKDVEKHKSPHYIAVKSILKCHEEVLQ